MDALDWISRCIALIAMEAPLYDIRSNWTVIRLIEEELAIVGCLGTTRLIQQARRRGVHCIAFCNSPTVIVETPRIPFSEVEHVKGDGIGSRVAGRRCSSIQT